MASRQAEYSSMAVAAETTFRVRLFGAPEVLRAESSVRLSPFQLGLVALIFGHGRDGLPRPRVAQLLWGSEAERDARHRIRQLLVEVRAKVGEGLVEPRGDHLCPCPDVPCDSWDFETALDRGDLHQAASSAESGFCVGVWPGLDEAFIDWRSASQEGLVRRLRGRAAAKWSRSVESCDWSSARDAAEALHALDPSDADAFEKLIEARGRSGALDAAESAFAAYMESIDSERPPSDSILRAIGRVRRLERGPHNGARRESEVPMVGRLDALEAGRSLFERIAEGRFGFVLVSGESGIGKTRLLRELHREAAYRDIRCLTAQAVELESRIPLNPLLDALRGVDLRTHLRALGRPWSAVIGAVLPAGSLDEPAEELPPIQESALPRRLLDAFFLLLERMAAEKPTILFIDDLQWADETTVAALQFVQRRWAHGSLGIMAAVRPDLVAPTDAVAKYLSAADGLAMRRIELRELSEADAMQLVRHVSQGTIGELRSRQICELACLHPLYLTEITRDYIGGRLKIPEQPAEAVNIPVSLEQILNNRLQNIGGKAMKLAGFLAAAARPMRVSALMSLSELDLDDTTDAIEELRRARLVESDHDNVRIAHDLFRSAIYKNLGEVRRAVNHRALAAHIVAEAPEEAAGELAIHYARAGECELAAKYGWLAADRAMETGTVAEAAHFYQLVSENEPVTSRRAEATAGFARALHLGRDITRANPVLELAASALRAAGKPGDALRLEIKRVEGLAEVGAAPIAVLVDRLSQLKDEATRNADWEAVALALDVELHLLHRAGDVDGIRQIFSRMRELTQRGSIEASLLAHAGLALGVLYGDPDEALQSATRAVGLAAEAPGHRLVALTRLLVVFQYRGMLQLPTSWAVITEARSLAERSGDVLLRFSIESNLAIALLDAGDVDGAEVLMARSTRLLGSADMNLSRFHEAIHRAELALAQRDFKRATVEYTEAASYLGATGPWYVRETVSAGLGLCALETGNLAEARRRELELPETTEHWYFDPSVILAFKVRLLERRGRHAEGLDLLEKSAQNLERRLVLAWFKVRAMQVRLMIKRGIGDAREIARMARERAESLCLHNRMREFAGLLRLLE